MKTAYVMVAKRPDKIKKRIEYYLNKFFKRVVEKNNVYIIYSLKHNNKIKELLVKHDVELAIFEPKINIEYAKPDGRFLLKYMLPETLKYCTKQINKPFYQVSIAVSKYTTENIEIIKKIADEFKNIKIITQNKLFDNLEKELEKNEIYITTMNNRRMALKNTNILINIDYKSITSYVINKNMFILDLKGNLDLPKKYTGTYIKGLKVDTDKTMNVLNDFEGMDRSGLLEIQMASIDDYRSVRKFIEINKFKIVGLIGRNKEYSIKNIL